MAPIRPRQTGTNKYGFRNRKSPVRSPATPQKHQRAELQHRTPNPAEKADLPETTSAEQFQTPKTNRNALLKRGRPEGTERRPIVLLEDFEFIIKLEDDTPVKAEADIEPGRVGPPPTKVEHDGIRQTRGYAMTPIQELKHSLKQKDIPVPSRNNRRVSKHFDGGIRKRICKPVGNAVLSPSNTPTIKANRSSFWFAPRRFIVKKQEDEDIVMDEAEDGHRVVGDDSWAQRDAIPSPYPDKPERQCSIVSPSASPSPREFQVAVINELSHADLAMFRKAFRTIWFGLGYETIGSVINSVNGWLEGRRRPYKREESIFALKSLEKEGKMCMRNGKVYWPWAYFMMDSEVKIELPEKAAPLKPGLALSAAHRDLAPAVAPEGHLAAVPLLQTAVTPQKKLATTLQESHAIRTPRCPVVAMEKGALETSRTQPALASRELIAFAPQRDLASISEGFPAMRFPAAALGKNLITAGQKDLTVAPHMRSATVCQALLAIPPETRPTVFLQKGPTLVFPDVPAILPAKPPITALQHCPDIKSHEGAITTHQQSPAVASQKVSALAPRERPLQERSNIQRDLSVQPSSMYESPVPISHARFMIFRRTLASLLGSPLFSDDCADFDAVLAAINERLPGSFSGEEGDQALERLSKNNKVMYTGGMVYKI